MREVAKLSAFILLIIGTLCLVFNEFIFDWSRAATLTFAISNFVGIATLAFITWGVKNKDEGGIVMGDASFSIGMLLGAIAGIGIGVSIGIAIGKKQKPWSELTDTEKKIRIASITAGVVLLVAGVVVFLILLFS